MVRNCVRWVVLAPFLLALVSCHRSGASGLAAKSTKTAMAVGAKNWTVPGIYHWVVPASDVGSVIMVTAVGGAGGGGNVGWVRHPGDGSAYTCAYYHDCAGNGGGGGGATALSAGNAPLVLAYGGGGGGGGANHDGSVRGGYGGFGAIATAMIPVVATDHVATTCPAICVYAGEQLTVTVGAGGSGASANKAGVGGLGFVQAGGTGGTRCGGRGGTGGSVSGGGGGGAACHWNELGGAGGSGGFGGGGGGGTTAGINCFSNGGGGGNARIPTLMSDYSPGSETPGGIASGQAGACGGGLGGRGTGTASSQGTYTSEDSFPGNGTYTRGSGGTGHNGWLYLTW